MRLKKLLTLAVYVATLTVSGLAGFANTVSAQSLMARGSLGWVLFHDTIMSAPIEPGRLHGNTACATCHDLLKHGGSDGLSRAVGMRERGRYTGPPSNAPLVVMQDGTFGREGLFKTPTILFTAGQQLQFWNGRTESLVDQVTLPLTNPIEMGNRSVQDVANRINAAPGYVRMFEAAFGPGARANRDTIALALSTYIKPLISTDAPIDRAMEEYRRGENSGIFTKSQELGYTIFTIACQSCHSGPMFRDGSFHNTGWAFLQNSGQQDRRSVTQGRGTQLDNRAFKTATMREVQAQGRWFHDGRARSLERVVAHYGNSGFGPNGARDPLIDLRVTRIRLDSDQQRALVDFLQVAFHGENYPKIRPPTEFPRSNGPVLSDVVLNR